MSDTSPPGFLFVAVDVGCHECGVGSEVIGAYWSERDAEQAADERSASTKDWRDGGQSIPAVFRVALPDAP